MEPSNTLPAAVRRRAPAPAFFRRRNGRTTRAQQRSLPRQSADDFSTTSAIDAFQLLRILTTTGVRYLEAPTNKLEPSTETTTTTSAAPTTPDRRSKLSSRDAAARDHLERYDLPVEPKFSLLPLKPTPPVSIRGCKAFLSTAEADKWLELLIKSLPWGSRELVYQGRLGIEPRQTCFFTRPIGDTNLLNYRYSEKDHEGQLMPEAMNPLVELLETSLKEQAIIDSTPYFNFVLCNQFRNGRDYVGWHSDDESVLEGPIVIVSLGHTRDFLLKARSLAPSVRAVLTAEAISEHEALGNRGLRIAVESGDLIVMNPKSQLFFRHSIPRRRALERPRITLTFRRLKVLPSNAS